MKKLLTIAMISLAAMAAKADYYLYWTVSADAWNGATYAGLYSGDTVLDAAPIGEEAQTDVTGYTSYWVMLYDQAMNEIAISTQAVTFEQIRGMGISPIWDTSSTTGGPSGNYYTFSSFMIPEPTSGLMLLIGLAGLALKRKVA